MHGYDFHRQKPVGPYIVDFFCPKLMLAIEIDGESHRNKGDYDAMRQSGLEAFGLKVLRFDDAHVRCHPQDVLRALEGWILVEEERATGNGESSG
jgi:very-short-patch-repair endonuclease